MNFAVYSANATKIELCLFDASGKKEIARIPLPQKTGDIWHGYLPNVKPGQLYGFRAYGPNDPANGHLFNPNKLLLDPYAQEIVGTARLTTAAQTDFSKDNAADTPKARVVAPLPPRTTPIARPDVPKDKSLIYELHVKGFTQEDPDVPQKLRGTYAALKEPGVIDKLKKLGVTAVELLPVHAKIHETRLEKAGLENYWGYNTIGFFAPEPEYLATGTREEFRDMVDALHAAGIEVILDVVYNHTSEGEVQEPALAFRGLDNAGYYKLDPNDRSKYINETGCGNTLDAEKPAVRRLITDSLKYWVEEFGVDGFRFDLAPVLGRTPQGFDPHGQLLKDIAADPVLSRVKLIAEPWDIGPGGYQLGNFPAGWGEWNDKFRDDVRAYWRGDMGKMGDLATRLAGSADIFNKPDSTPQDSINFVACHDGFPLGDVVSYDTKHNEANGENNRDGTKENFSCNHGTEGETSDAAIRGLREQQKRNMLATLFLAQGTPMLLAGDETGNSQRGNNNAYCQDNPTGWIDKDNLSAEDLALQEFTRKLSLFRREHALLTQKKFLHGKPVDADGTLDLQWFSETGKPMTAGDWGKPWKKCLGMMLAGAPQDGEKSGARLLAVFNAASNPVPFKLPGANGAQWQRALDTSEPDLKAPQDMNGNAYTIPARAVIVFTAAAQKEDAPADNRQTYNLQKSRAFKSNRKPPRKSRAFKYDAAA